MLIDTFPMFSNWAAKTPRRQGRQAGIGEPSEEQKPGRVVRQFLLCDLGVLAVLIEVSCYGSSSQSYGKQGESCFEGKRRTAARGQRGGRKQILWQDECTSKHLVSCC